MFYLINNFFANLYYFLRVPQLSFYIFIILLEFLNNMNFYSKNI